MKGIDSVARASCAVCYRESVARVPLLAHEKARGTGTAVHPRSRPSFRDPRADFWFLGFFWFRKSLPWICMWVLVRVCVYRTIAGNSLEAFAPDVRISN